MCHSCIDDLEDLMLSVSCFLFLAPTYSQSIHASQNPLPVGSNVTLSSQASVVAGAWIFNSDIIVMIFPGGEIISNGWKDRITFNSTSNNMSLTIRSVQSQDSGLFTLQAVNSFRAQLTLSVQGKTPLSMFMFTLSHVFFHSAKVH